MTLRPPWQRLAAHGVALGLLLALGACESKPLVTVDSNTNWLRCDTSSACGDGENCVCGVCAGACEPETCQERGGVCTLGDDQLCSTTPVASGGVCLPSDIAGGWHVTASSSQVVNEPGDLLYNPPENALDGALPTRWSSGKPQAGDEWFQLDFGQTLSVRSIDLDMGADASVQSYMDFPRGYFVSVSDEPNDATAVVVASGVGRAPITHIDLRGERVGRYVLIRQTNEATNWWSIHELRADVSWPLPPQSTP